MKINFRRKNLFIESEKWKIDRIQIKSSWAIWKQQKLVNYAIVIGQWNEKQNYGQYKVRVAKTEQSKRSDETRKDESIEIERQENRYTSSQLLRSDEKCKKLRRQGNIQKDELRCKKITSIWSQAKLFELLRW
jgi:hypothetical protein